MKDQIAKVRERIKKVYGILEQDNYHTENKILQEALTILDNIAQAHCFVELVDLIESGDITEVEQITDFVRSGKTDIRKFINGRK